MDPESGYSFHGLPHNGLLNPYSYPELPALMMSNMLGQDSHLLAGPMHAVSPPSSSPSSPPPRPLLPPVHILHIHTSLSGGGCNQGGLLEILEVFFFSFFFLF